MSPYEQKKKLPLCPDKNGPRVGTALLCGPEWSSLGQCTPRRSVPCPSLFPVLLLCHQCLPAYFPCQWFSRETTLRVCALDGEFKLMEAFLLRVTLCVIPVCNSWWCCDWTKLFTGDASVAAVGKERDCPGLSVNTGSQLQFPFLQCFLLRPKCE